MYVHLKKNNKEYNAKMWERISRLTQAVGSGIKSWYLDHDFEVSFFGMSSHESLQKQALKQYKLQEFKSNQWKIHLFL